MANEAMDFTDFMMSLDGRKHSDFALLVNMKDQCERVYRETGKPIAIEAMKTERLVYQSGVWGRDTVHVLVIYCDDHGTYKEMRFASKPIFDTLAVDDHGYPVWSEYFERVYANKSAMANGKAFLWPFYVLSSESITKEIYPGNQAFTTKQIIEGTYDLWAKPVEDIIETEEDMSA